MLVLLSHLDHQLVHFEILLRAVLFHSPRAGGADSFLHGALVHLGEPRISLLLLFL